MIAEVILNSKAKDLDRSFDYEVPKELEEKIKIGNRVLVPFGRRKILEEGFVINLKKQSEYETKPIKSIEENPFLNENKIKLAKWISKRYFCNLSDSIKLMLPPGTKNSNTENRIKDKTLNFVYLKKSEDEIEIDIENKKIKSEKQIRILHFLMENDAVTISDLEIFTDTSRAIIKTLEKNNYIEIIEKEVERNPFLNKNIQRTTKLTFTKEQQNAYEKIEKSIKQNENKEFLIFGVTGSGKTEIYLQSIEKVLEEGKNSIILVPEISLTPQMVDRFIARFGQEKIAVIHSKLSIGERYDAWKKIASGKIKIVIGARSAIFAPLKNIGLIIIDEEHDSSYQSEMTPKYDAKEIARYIARENSCPLILGSATPDMKTYYKASKGEISLLELTKRANNSKLPTVKIVDLKNVDNKIEEKKEELNNIKEEKTDTMSQVEELTNKISSYQQQIEELDSKINDLNTQISDFQEQLNKAQEDYTKQEELLNARLVATYEAGDTSYLDFILSSESITDLISNYYLISEIATNDSELLEKIQKQKETIENALYADCIEGILLCKNGKLRAHIVKGCRCFFCCLGV